MRVALARLGAIYAVAAGLFGGAMLVGTTSNATGVPGTDAAIHGWLDRFQLRVNAQETVTLSIVPSEPPLRRFNPDDDTLQPPPSFQPPKPEPHEIKPEKPSSPLIIRYAGLENLAPVPVSPELPMPQPLADVKALKLPADFASLASITPLRVAPSSRTSSAPELTVPAVHIAERLRDHLSDDLYANFDLFLYVSKSSDGPLSQHMYVFAKDRADTNSASLRMLHDWPVSTGRERNEIDTRGFRSSTATPAGYYQLDPKRFYRKYISTQWGKPMPNSMFFDWMVQGYRTGLAIHGVTDPDELSALGTRASAGCVHLSPDAAQSLFAMIKTEYKGQVPSFAYNTRTKTISNDGKLERDRKGALRMVDGYKALVVIENYGGQDMMTELDGVDSLRPQG